MKKLLKVLAVAVFALTPFLAGFSASAASTCQIGYTGPDSNNQCTSVTKYTCTINNTNTVTITNDNNQVVASGTVSVSGNGQGGSATSGATINNNGTTYSVTITNSNPALETPGTCTATVVIPATETPSTPAPVQPTHTGNGATSLPKTSGDFTKVLFIVAGSLAALAALGVGGVALYRYYKSL